MSDQLLPIVAGVAVGLALLLLALAGANARVNAARRERRARVMNYSVAHTSHTSFDERHPVHVSIARGVSLRMDSVLHRIGLYRRMYRGLDNAGLSLSPGAWTSLSLLATLAGGLLLSLLLSSVFWGFLLALILGILVPRVVLARREASRKKEFEQGLPEFFLLMSSALRSGLSFPQALETVAREGQGEVERQMRRAVTEVSMGVPPDRALEQVADRMNSEDMRWAVIAISIQREVGGNLSGILDSVADTVRGRAEISREVDTLSAEGRLSGVVLLALPIAIFLFLFVTRREYVEIFWTTGIGRFLLALTIALFVVGGLWMRTLLRVRA